MADLPLNFRDTSVNQLSYQSVFAILIAILNKECVFMKNYRLRKITLSIIMLLTVTLMVIPLSSLHAAAPTDSRLDTILKQGFIRIGTTGDYKPFSFLNPDTNEFEGHDIDAAQKLGEALGVKVVFVKTTWPNLMGDLLADKYDIGMSGITRTFDRQKKAHFSQGYILFGKSPLIRSSDKDRFQSLSDIDKSGVKVGVNPGGTNERFVRAHIKNAEIVLNKNNLEIPGMVADGRVDVMITDSIEAIRYARFDDRLFAAMLDKTFTKNKFGYMIQRGDPTFANFIDFWMEEMFLRGDFEKLAKDWID